MAALDSIYDNLLNEAWSKTIAGNGKNTLLVHTQAEFKPEDTYYVFVCQLSKVSERYAWVTGDRAIDFSVGGNEENWKNLRIIEDRLIKGSDVISYIKNKENKILSGLTQYILDIKYIDPAIKDAVFASLITNTKSGPGRFEVGFYFVNANIAGQPDLKTYYNIVKALRDSSKNSNLKPIQIAAQTLPYIEDLINVRNIHHKNAEITGIDTSGLLESVNWDDPYPYGKIDSIVTSTIKSYNPDFIDADVNDAYSAFYGWLQKQEDLPDDMGVQEWYDNAVENFRDADQYERRGMDEDEEAAAEEGYIDAAENLLIQQLNAFFNGDSEEYKDFLKSRAIHKKGSEISGIDTSGLLEGGLSFDAGTDKFNFVEYCKSLSLNDTDIKSFADWIVNYSEIAEEVRDYGGEPEDESWVKVSIYYDANIENTAYLAAEKHDLSILLDRLKEIKIEVVKLYNQYRDFTDFHKGASEIAGIDTTGLIETTTEICEQATLNPNGELIFGKYRIFKAGSGTQTAPYAQAINDTNLFSKRLADDVKVLETLGFKFDTVYYYQPPPRAGKYIARAIAISGTDNNGEDIMWVRKGGFMAPSPAIYYKDSRAGDVKRMARLLSLQLKPTNVVTVEDFLKAAVGPTGVTPKSGGWGYKSKKIKLRPDGKYDILGEISLRKDYSYALVGKPFFINSLDDLPIKFGVIKGDLIVGLPVLNLDWFPEMVDGGVWFKEEAEMSPEKFLEAGLLERVTDNTEISFTTKEVNKYGLNKIIKFKSKADWIDTIKAQDIHQKSSDITGIDTSGLIEEGATVDKITETIKALMEVDSFEDFKRIAKQLPDLSNTIDGTPVSLLIQYAIWDNIGILVGDGSQSLWFPTTPQDFFYKALYYYLRFHSSDSKSSRAFNKSLSYRQGPSLEELENAFNKWRDFKTSQNIHQKSTDITGIDTSGLLESWTDKDIEDYWKHYYNVGDPGPIGAIKDWPGLLFFNKWFVDMIDRENWNVDSIEDYFIEYSDRVADNLEQKDNEDRGYGELQEIACYRGYKKLYNYYRQFLADTDSQIYKDWKSSEAIHQKTTDITGIDTSGLLEASTLALKSKEVKNAYLQKFVDLVDEASKCRSFREFEAAIKKANIEPSGLGHRGEIRSAFRILFGIDTMDSYTLSDNGLNFKNKYGPLFWAINDFLQFNHLKATDKRKFASELNQVIRDVESYFHTYLDYVKAEEIHQKSSDITGIDTSGLLEQGKPALKKPYVTEFNSIITKAKDARTFNDFEAAFEGTDPNIWNTNTTGKFFHKVFVAYFNSEPPVEPLALVKINSKNDYERTKFGHLNEAINHYGEYLLLSKTDAEADRFSGEDARSEAAFVYRKQAENYFNYYLDIINAEEIHKKATDITGIDTSGLLEAYIWKGFPDEYLTDSFTKLIKKAAAANTFEEFLAAHDDVDPKIWSTARAEPFYFKIFQHIFNADLYKNKDGTRGTFIGPDTKLGALYRAIEKMGFYTVTAKTDHSPWHHNAGTKEYRAASDKKIAKHYFDIYKDIVDSENIHQKSTDITGIDTSGLLESYDRSTIAEWVVIMVKAAEIVAQDPKKITSDVKRANAVPADFWSPVIPSDGTIEGIGNSFINTIKQAQKFDLYNGNFTPVPGKFKVMKHDPNRPGSMPNGYQFYPGNLNSSKARTFIEYDLYDRAHRALLTAMYKVAKQEGSPLGSIPAEVLDGALRGFIRGDYKKTEAIYKDYLDAQNIHQKSSDITGIDTSGLLESNKVFNPEIYDTYNKALEANSFEEFKELIKQLPDPWKYDVMVGGGANARAIIKDILGLKDIPSSYNPKTPADHFLTAVDHIQDVEHSTTVTLDDIRAGYAYAQEHFAKWLDYKKSQEIHQKTTDITGIDTSGLMEEAASVSHDKRFALMKWARAIPDSNEFARHWALTSGFSEEDIENFGGQQWLIDGLIDWFVDMESDATKYAGGRIYDMGKLSLEQQIALYQKLEDGAVEVVKRDLEELYKDWKTSREIHSKGTDITGIDTSGLLESNDNLTSDQDKTLFFRTVENYKKYLPVISDADLIGFYDWFNNVKRVELSFGPYAGDNESSWDVFQQITWVAAEDVYGIPEHEIPDEFRSVAEMTMEKLYEEYKAHYIYKKSSEITGIDTSGLLEARDVSSQEIHDRLLIRWKEGFIDEFKKVIKLPEEEGEKVYQWLLNKATETDCEEPRMYATKAEEIYDRTAALYAEFVEEADTPGVKYTNRHKAAMKLIYKVYLDELKAQQIHQTTTGITGIDTSGLLESEDDDASRERYWDHALEATATDWINSFKSYVGLERANKIYTWMLNKARAGHDSQATYNNLIDMYGQFARERRKKDGLRDWVEPDTAKVLADIADAYDAEIITQKTTDITGIDAAGLLEAARYTGPLGPVKDKQGKEHDYQGWYNIIKPFIIDLLKAAENNDFSSFVKLVDGRQKNMGGPGFNPYFNLTDKVYAKVLQELLDNEQAENAFDEAYSSVQSIIVYIDVHLKGQWDRDPNTLQSIPNAQIKQEYPKAVADFNKFKDFLDAKNIHQKATDITGIDTSGLLENSQFADQIAKGFQNVYFWFNRILPEGWEKNTSAFRKWANTQKINSDRVSSDEEFWQDYWDYKIEEVHYNLRNQGIDADITRCRDRVKEEIKGLYNQFLISDWFKDYSASQDIHQKATDITGIDTSGLLEAKPRSTPEQDKYWGGIIYDYINKLINANTFEEFMGLVEEKPATFQFNSGMYYHDKIFVNAIDSILGGHNKETGNPVRSSFVAAFSDIQGFVSYIDLFYNKEETTPLLEKHRAAARKKFDQWIEVRQDWIRSQEIHQKSTDITGIDTSGLLE